MSSPTQSGKSPVSQARLFPPPVFFDFVPWLPGAMAQRGGDSSGSRGWPTRFDPSFVPPQAPRGRQWWPRWRGHGSPYSRPSSSSSSLSSSGAASRATPSITLPGHRRDAPILQQRRGPARIDEGLAAPEVQQVALDDLRRDVFAPSHAAVVEAKLKTIRKALSLWHLDVLPPPVATIEALAASLKWGGYRSAASYLSVYKGYAERAGYQFAAPEARALTDAIRSCERGMGGPTKAMALPFDRLRELPGTRSPWAVGGPVSPRNMIVAGSWFLMREIELSTAKAQSVTIDAAAVPPRVLWHLPVSKVDPKALGTSRVHGCACTSSGPSAACPTHAIWDQLLYLAKTFPKSFSTASGVPQCTDPDLPLFPCLGGEVATKAKVTDTILAAAGHLRVPVSVADGSERISGHSLRATGAQGLSALGLDLWAIQLLGRWGSDAVKGYVREAHIQKAADWASSASRRRELEALVADVVAQHAVRGSVGPPQASDVAAALETVNLETPQAKDMLDMVAEEATLKIEDQARANEEQENTKYVRNEASNVLHRVARGPPLYLISDWASTCGWKFGRSPMSRILDSAELPENPDWICGRCLRPEREAAQVAARIALQQQGD